MTDIKGEIHGCIVCGKLHQLYVVRDAKGTFVDSKVMSGDGHEVKGYGRPLVACGRHSDEDVQRAADQVYGSPGEDG